MLESVDVSVAEFLQVINANDLLHHWVTETEYMLENPRNDYTVLIQPTLHQMLCVTQKIDLFTSSWPKFECYKEENSSGGPK